MKTELTLSLYIFAIYFLVFDFILLIMQPMTYIFDAWSIFKVTPMILVMINATPENVHAKELAFWRR
jgi:NADH:ubiquinone oxidoreductase subunit 3 (subunit A)